MLMQKVSGCGGYGTAYALPLAALAPPAYVLVLTVGIWGHYTCYGKPVTADETATGQQCELIGRLRVWLSAVSRRIRKADLLADLLYALARRRASMASSNCWRVKGLMSWPVVGGMSGDWRRPLDDIRMM